MIAENAAHARWVKANLHAADVVAITATAADTLEALGVPHRLAAEFVSMTALASAARDANARTWTLATDLERFGAAHHPDAIDAAEPGVVSGHAYALQHSTLTIAARWWIVARIAVETGASAIHYLDTPVHFWFTGDGYAENPWTMMIRAWAATAGISLTVQVIDEGQSLHQGGPGPLDTRWMSRLMRGSRRALHRLVPRRPYADPDMLSERDRESLRGLTMLAVGGVSFDWSAVAPALEAAGARMVTLPVESVDTRFWNVGFGSMPGVPSPVPDTTETERLGRIFDEWAGRCAPALPLLGADLFPAIAPHVRAVFQCGPALSRHAAAVSRETLDRIRPDVVTFFAMPWLVTHSFALQARRRKIPVICYQHGGTYGTHDLPKQGLLEWSQADAMLTYGRAIVPPQHPWRPVTARVVTVGSARTAVMVRSRRRARSAGSIVRVLWIAEISTLNTIGSDFQVEDTRRYRLQTRALERLGRASGLRVMFRPYPGKEPDGTTAWVRRRQPGVTVDTTRSMSDALAETDLVISDSSSGTAWNEVLAARLPLVLFCDPAQTALVPSFAAVLDAACLWCRSDADLMAAVDRLAVGPQAFLVRERRDPTTFLDQYVLPQDGPGPVARAVAFLASLRRPHAVNPGEGAFRG